MRAYADSGFTSEPQDLLPSDQALSLSLIDTSLRVIEVCISADPAASYILLPHLPSFTTSVSSLLHFCLIILRTELREEEEKNQAAMDCLASVLRMLGELTILDPAWSIAFAETKYGVATLVNLIGIVRGGAKLTPQADEEDDQVDGHEEKRSRESDILCLALGVLTNLVETVDTTRDTLREIRSSCSLPLYRSLSFDSLRIG